MRKLAFLALLGLALYYASKTITIQIEKVDDVSAIKNNCIAELTIDEENKRIRGKFTDKLTGKTETSYAELKAPFTLLSPVFGIIISGRKNEENPDLIDITSNKSEGLLSTVNIKTGRFE